MFWSRHSQIFASSVSVIDSADPKSPPGMNSTIGESYVYRMTLGFPAEMRIPRDIDDRGTSNFQNTELVVISQIYVRRNMKKNPCISRIPGQNNRHRNAALFLMYTNECRRPI